MQNSTDVMFESGFNMSLGYNTSQNNTANGLPEFPLWQPLVAINLFLYLGILAPSTLFFNISVFITLLKCKLSNKPLTVLYGSLLLGLCLDKLLACVEELINEPLQIRHCICLEIVVELLIGLGIFFNIYSVIIVTCQSTLQLLILQGKKKWYKNYKPSLACIVLSVAVAGFWTLANIMPFFFASNSMPLCTTVCSPPSENVTMSTEAKFIVVGVYGVITLAPAVIVTIVTSIYSLVIFKTRILRTELVDDKSLNRKMILLPVLMVILVLSTNLNAFVASSITSVILRQVDVGPYYGNWTLFIRSALSFVTDALHGIAYPVILLILNTTLRKKWKSILFKKPPCWHSNKVHPNSSPYSELTE